MVPVVDEGDGGEDGDGGDEDPGDDEAERPQGLPRVQAHVRAASPAMRRTERNLKFCSADHLTFPQGWGRYFQKVSKDIVCIDTDTKY